MPSTGSRSAKVPIDRAIADSGFVAMGALAMHGREHVVVIHPNTSGHMLHTLFFANEVSRPEAAVDNSLVSDTELELAKMLRERGHRTVRPTKRKDTYKEKRGRDEVLPQKILRLREPRRNGGARHAQRAAQAGSGRRHDGRATEEPRCGSKAGAERRSAPPTRRKTNGPRT